MTDQPKGFAALTKERRIEIARLGGKKSKAGGFKDKEFARIMGSKGGRISRRRRRDPKTLS